MVNTILNKKYVLDLKRKTVIFQVIFNENIIYSIKRQVHSYDSSSGYDELERKPCHVQVFKNICSLQINCGNLIHGISLA